MKMGDKRDIAHSFNLAASRYDQAAQLQQEVGRRLLEDIDIFKIKPQRVLDLGCGTGQIGRDLSKIYKGSEIVYADLADKMVVEARRQCGFWQRRKSRFVNADAERLPFADQSFDLLTSNLTFQWCANLEALFEECFRVLRPGGLLLFTTLGPNTLQELRRSWARVDNLRHVNHFIDMHDIGDAMQQAGLRDAVTHMEEIIIHYSEAVELMRDLKDIGAHNIHPEREKGLTPPAHLKQVIAHYEAFRNDSGMLPATYEVVYGQAWRLSPLQSSSVNGEFTFSATAIKSLK